MPIPPPPPPTPLTLRKILEFRGHEIAEEKAGDCNQKQWVGYSISCLESPEEDSSRSQNMLFSSQTDFYLHDVLPFLHNVVCSTSFGYSIIHHTYQSWGCEVCLVAKWKVVGRPKTDSCSVHSLLSSFNMWHVTCHWAVALNGDAKQAMHKWKKCGLVETARPVATALACIEGNKLVGSYPWILHFILRFYMSIILNSLLPT